MRRTLLLLIVLTLTAALPVQADEIRLQNGDRYTGTVVSLAGGTLTFRTAGGTVTIPVAQVTALTIDQPLLVTSAGSAPVLAQPGPVTLAGIVTIAAPTPPLVVDGSANAGFVSTGGNTDVNSLRLDTELVARARANRYTAAAAINRAEDRDEATAENWNASAKYDRFVTPRLFVNANGIFTHDSFRDLDLRSALGAGVGYQVIDSPRARLTVDGGAGYVSERLNAQPDDSYAALRESAKLDVFMAARRLQLFHSHDTYVGVTGDDNLFVRMQNGVRMGIAAGLVSTLQFDVDYDHSPAAGRRNTDRTFALTFGYRF